MLKELESFCLPMESPMRRTGSVLDYEFQPRVPFPGWSAEPPYVVLSERIERRVSRGHRVASNMSKN